MNTLNSGAEASQSQPQKVSAIPGLGAKIAAAFAALGIMISAEKVEAAVTASMPVIVAGSGLEQITTPGRSNIWSSRTLSNGATAETISQIRLSVSAADAGPNGGTLTVSGYSRLVTGVSSPTIGQGYASTFADINQEIRGGIVGQSVAVLGTFNGPGFTNDSNRQFNGIDPITGLNEGFDVNQPFSFTIAVPAGGMEYNLQNVAQALNADATIRLAGDVNGSTPINLSFTQVPEPDATLLAGAGATLALLRRKRKMEK